MSIINSNNDLFSLTLGKPHFSTTHLSHGLKPVGVDLEIRLCGKVQHHIKLDAPAGTEVQTKIWDFPQNQGLGGTYEFVLDPEQLLRDASKPLGT